MTQLFLGIDGGGTKTEVICGTATGEIVGKGLSGPTNLTSITIGAATFNLKEAIRQALENAPPDHQVVAAAMGLAGMDTKEEYEMAYQPFSEILKSFNVQQFMLVHDSFIALENGTANPNAVVLISGTGSICVGRNEKGETHKTGGMDYLLTDQGSGYDIGRHVLREAVKSHDGRRSKTLLEKLVCEHFGLTSLDALKMKVYHPPLTKVEVAELSMVCTKAYEQGDDAARQIFEWAKVELVKLVQPVMKQLSLAYVPTDLVMTGSIVKLQQIQTQVFEQLHAEFPLLSLVDVERSVVHGALNLAIKHPKIDVF